MRLAPPPDIDRAAEAAARAHGGGGSDALAPMPGRILAVHVGEGAIVEAGAPVVTLEAMKMEHIVPAPTGGVVRDLVRPGDQVERGARLARIDPPDEGPASS